eukprot:gene5428-9241_t
MKVDDLVYDFGNLTALDTHPLNIEEYNKNKEEYLLNSSTENVQLFVTKLFEQNDLEEDEEGIHFELPSSEIRLPREKSLPKPKEPTRWEVLAKKKNILKQPKDKLVYSEAHDEFRTRYGYKSKNEGEDQRNWIVEAKPSDALGIDPFLEKRLKKKKMKEVQSVNELSNISKRAKAEGRLIPNAIKEATSRSAKKKRQKHNLDLLEVAKNSTASIGNFDKKVKGEPKKNEIHTKNKQRFAPNSISSAEKTEQSKLLNRILKTQDEKNNRKLKSKASNVYQKNIEKQSRMNKKGALLGQNKSRWYLNKKNKND